MNQKGKRSQYFLPSQPLNKMPLAINLHVWPRCNYYCRFCFASFNNYDRILSVEQQLRLIECFASWGVQKVNFAGGEPTLCPYLGKLLEFSKDQGFKTSIISNGTGINKEFLRSYHGSIDWIGLSIDSGNEITQALLGRGNGTHVASIIKKAKLVKEFSINLKINTVVTSFNYQEDMNWLIQKLRPNRWKVFQILLIKKENQKECRDLVVTDAQFERFVKRHEAKRPIVENNDLMLNSYLMVDPSGRFFQNTGFCYSYSRPILEVGVETAFQDIVWDRNKFIRRGGIYNWGMR
jgi:radical S-adenosyl methionine domain-containing protein 2